MLDDSWVHMSCPEDVRMDLRRVQHELYSELVGWLYGSARRRYLEAARLVNVETELSEALADMYTFDHRTLQEAHYLIADYYSVAHDDGGQLFIGEDAVTYKIRLHNSWRRFFQREVRRLLQQDEFTLAILTAAVFANQERGVAAEAQYHLFLEDDCARG